MFIGHSNILSLVLIYISCLFSLGLFVFLFLTFRNLLYVFLINLFYFIYFWLHWVFVAARRLSLVVRSGGFSLRWLLLLQSTGSRRAGFSSCGTWAQQFWLSGSRVQAPQLWRTGLAAPRHVGSSRTGARTRVPCIGRWILNHYATREALAYFLMVQKNQSNIHKSHPPLPILSLGRASMNPGGILPDLDIFKVRIVKF